MRNVKIEEGKSINDDTLVTSSLTSRVGQIQLSLTVLMKIYDTKKTIYSVKALTEKYIVGYGNT